MACDQTNTLQSARATEGEIQRTIFGLEGVFFALEMLSSQQVTDDIVDKKTLENGIANLILAGRSLADEISRRF